MENLNLWTFIWLLFGVKKLNEVIRDLVKQVRDFESQGRVQRLRERQVKFISVVLGSIMAGRSCNSWWCAEIREFDLVQ